MCYAAEYTRSQSPFLLALIDAISDWHVNYITVLQIDKIMEIFQVWHYRESKGVETANSKGPIMNLIKRSYLLWGKLCNAPALLVHIFFLHRSNMKRYLPHTHHPLTLDWNYQSPHHQELHNWTNPQQGISNQHCPMVYAMCEKIPLKQQMEILDHLN